MWNAVTLISTGLVMGTLGFLATLPAVDDQPLRVTGYVLLTLGAVVTSVGVIAAGVLVALDERDER